ncbi:MAG: PEGA domain-containing protein [Planctomycetales bacterium]|nr:PEGA domain-containing protein [Planctomycetales bacterium]
MNRWKYWLIALSLVLAAGGCVRRRMTIRSNPPGAMVYIDDQQIGSTPVSTSFTYYGTRSVTLVKDGYETQTVKHTLDRPWYQIPPLDFVSENVSPAEHRDEHVLDFTLTPQRMVPTEELWRNAENLRSSAQRGYVVPLPGAANGAPAFVPPGATNGASYPQPPTASGIPLGNTNLRGPWR